MCGIAALSLKEPAEDAEQVVAAMARRQRHRGPDHQATYLSPTRRVALSHARLSIVDLSPRGHQPMANEDDTLWLVCNGEIYNHAELRRDLEAKGHRFRSQSDSEVILHLYETEGLGLLERLHGMFAFALYDWTQDILLCARDRLGKKPLVYAQTAQGVAVASEIPAIRCFGGVDLAVDPVALGLYLLRNLRHIPDPWTYFRGIRCLLPGHAMIVEQGKVRRIWRYWHPDYRPQPTTPEEVFDTFSRAVKMRQVADVEVGALLSGGVDSSGIVQTMAQESSKRVRTYALGRDRHDEDLQRARRVAQLYGTEHREFYWDPNRQHDQLEVLLRLHGEPIMLLPLLYTFELCRHVREDGVRVVLAGHGADELFYGYPGHTSLALMTSLIPFVPVAMQPWLGQSALRLPPGSPLREALLVASMPAGKRKSELYRDEARRVWASLLNIPDMEREIERTVAEWLETWFENNAPEAFIDEASILGLMHENRHSVTIAADLPAMAAGIEIRCPYLDQDLVQLAWRIPYRQKVGNMWNARLNKLVLKKAFEGRLPHDLLYADKRGFGFSISEEEVLRGAWRQRVSEMFAETDDLGGLLNSEALKTLKSTFDAGGDVPAALIAKLYAALLFNKIGHADN